MNTFNIHPDNDWIITAFALIIILLTLVVCEILVRRFRVNRSHTRKAIHILVGLYICAASVFLTSILPIMSVAVVFLLFDWWMLRQDYLKALHPDKQSFGTIYYPMSVLLLALIFWEIHREIFITAVLIMVVPDAMAAIVGEQYAKNYFRITGEKKSWPGFIAMLLSSTMIFSVFFYVFLEYSAQLSIIVAFLLGMLASAAEIISSRGSDNLSVPLVSALFLFAFAAPQFEVLFWQLISGIILSAITAVISLRFQFLSASGAVVTFILGSVIFGFGGLPYATPILAFFILSSLLTIKGKGRKKEHQARFEKSGTRDYVQVLANGALPGLLVLLAAFMPHENIYPLYIVALAAATADTWATELGIFSFKKPRLITNFRSVERGTSGAISVLGTFSAFTGGLLIVILGFIIYPEKFSIYVFIMAVLSGFIGSIADSLLGATVQAQYRCRICAKITEKKDHCDGPASLIRGSKAVQNDLVNFISISFAVFTMIISMRVL